MEDTINKVQETVEVKKVLPQLLSIERPREIQIMYAFNTNAFLVINKQYLPGIAPPIGSSKTATDAILRNYKELEAIMPMVLNASPNNKETDFNKEVKYYFDSFHVNIPEIGLKLQIGFIYDITDKSKIEDINYIMKLHNLKDANGLADFVEGEKNGVWNVPFEERYKYGTPIKAEDFIIYRYCQYYSLVANKPEDLIGKSKKIRYYIHDPETTRIEEKRTAGIKTKAFQAFTELITDTAKVDSVILNIAGTLSGLSDITDKHLYLQNYLAGNAEHFLSVYNDKSLTTKALINQLIDKSIFTKLENNVIFETADSSNLIGNNMLEAVAYFNNKLNEDKVNRFKLSLKTL
jgi:hypothetical protein